MEVMQVLKEFNDLLNRKPGVYIGYISNDGSSENNVDAAVSGKLTPERLKDAIAEAIGENLDVKDVHIVSAESYDSGYKLEIKVSYSQDEEVTANETYYISHAIIY